MKRLSKDSRNLIYKVPDADIINCVINDIEDIVKEVVDESFVNKTGDGQDGEPA